MQQRLTARHHTRPRSCRAEGSTDAIRSRDKEDELRRPRGPLPLFCLSAQSRAWPFRLGSSQKCMSSRSGPASQQGPLKNSPTTLRRGCHEKKRSKRLGCGRTKRANLKSLSAPPVSVAHRPSLDEDHSALCRLAPSHNGLPPPTSPGLGLRSVPEAYECTALVAAAGLASPGLAAQGPQTCSLQTCSLSSRPAWPGDASHHLGLLGPLLGPRFPGSRLPV